MIEIYIAIVLSFLTACFTLLSLIKNGKNNDEKQNLNIYEALNAIVQEQIRLKEHIMSIMRLGNENSYQNMDRLIKMINEKLSDLERRVDDMTKSNEHRLVNMRDSIDNNIKFLQQKNSEELKEMRTIVDEKLNQTLETRLNKSFEIINSRLEAVYKGLGEMQGLAKGVGDLKKVLSNVKVRGTFGEVQLSMLLEQILSQEQYEKNVVIDKRTSERVDFAIKMPGKNNDFVYLPIDAKFPLEEYNRLIEASENCDAAGIERYSKLLESRIMEEAKNISSKYIVPPYSTDFAIMYLPLEGLYAEVLKRDNVAENLQRKYRIILCGPTTLGALLNSLQMGFKTLAIEKRSSELWRLLSAFKTEFSRFTDILSKTQKKILEASDTIEDAAKKTRTIQRKLSGVSDIGQAEAELLLNDDLFGG